MYFSRKVHGYAFSTLTPPCYKTEFHKINHSIILFIKPTIFTLKSQNLAIFNLQKSNHLHVYALKS